MRRPNKRQRKKNAKRDGTAPTMRQIVTRFTFRADGSGLRRVEEMVRARRESLSAFMKLAYPEIKRSWHFDCICDHLASRCV